MKINKKNGFVVLYAVLVTTVIVAVGLIMSNIMVKQIILSTTGRDSQKAFYAANAGLECVIFWDREYEAFGYFISGIYENDIYSPIECNGQPIDIENGARSDGYKDDITIQFPDTNSMAIVSIDKNTSNPNSIIISKGYNSTDLSSPRLVQRIIRSDGSIHED